MKFYIEYYKDRSPTLGSYWSEKYDCVDRLEDCDVFINNYHQNYLQVHRLHQAARLNKRIINIGSAAAFWTKGRKNSPEYALEKKALLDANDALFWEGVNTTIINFGYLDTYRSRNKNNKKISLEYVDSVIMWVLEQPHRIKDITITP